MSYAGLGAQAGRRVRRRGAASKLGAGVGAYANPGGTVGAGVGGYANPPAAKVGAGVGQYPGVQARKAIGTTVGTAPLTSPAAAAGAAVGAGAQTPGASLGGDAGLLSAEDQALRNTSLADARYQYTVNALGADYGYDAAGNIDTNNPYGRAALMQHMATNQRRGTQTSYAAQGQLYSGALQNAQDENQRQAFIADDQLRKGYQGQVAQAGLERASTYSGQTAGVSQAALEALLRAIGGSS